MRKVLVLLITLGLMIGLSACGATVQQSVEAPSPGGGATVQAHPGEDLGYQAYQPEGWIEDTPYGY